jgi:centromere protein C
LQFWKNEKLIFEPHNETGLLGEAMGNMPVVTAVQLALPTPRKERLGHANDKKKEKDSKKKRARKSDGDEGDSNDGGLSAKIPFDPKQLMKKYRFINGEHGSVWSETLEDATDLKIVSRLEKRSFAKLPLSSTRGKKESKVVGFASRAFNVHTDPEDLFPGFISGNMVIPPRGIKDAEGVGLCSQVFNIGDCQPNSVEFALADPSSQDGEFDPDTAQRFLLSKGDMFQIPPGNIYKIENHSRTDEACLFWTIIKCTSKAEQESDEE